MSWWQFCFCLCSYRWSLCVPKPSNLDTFDTYSCFFRCRARRSHKYGATTCRSCRFRFESRCRRLSRRVGCKSPVTSNKRCRASSSNMLFSKYGYIRNCVWRRKYVFEMSVRIPHQNDTAAWISLLITIVTIFANGLHVCS